MVAAEVRTPAAELNSFGPMPTRVLSERCHAQQWRMGTLDRLSERAFAKDDRRGSRAPLSTTRPVASTAASERRMTSRHRAL
jgi:hypothetical protein